MSYILWLFLFLAQYVVVAKWIENTSKKQRIGFTKAFGQTRKIFGLADNLHY